MIFNGRLLGAFVAFRWNWTACPASDIIGPEAYCHAKDRILKFPDIFRCLPLHCLGMIAACNAIEPERIRPQAKVQMPEIQTDPAYVDYLLEPYQGSWLDGIYPVVHMRVPKAPYTPPVHPAALIGLATSSL